MKAVPFVSTVDAPPDTTATAKSFGIPCREILPEDPFYLRWDRDRVALYSARDPGVGGIAVDFIGGPAGYRRRRGGGRRQAIARAVGIKAAGCPSVLDMTAGLGRDAFVLAALGCRVHMRERCPAVALLLADGLRRAYADQEIGPWMTARVSFALADGLVLDKALPFAPDVIYLDPMYPAKRKKALVKKEMRLFQELVGKDEDAGRLLSGSLGIARSRVVVKRPSQAPWLEGKEPDTVVRTPKNRFDLYFKRREDR